MLVDVVAVVVRGVGRLMFVVCCLLYGVFLVVCCVWQLHSCIVVLLCVVC